MAKCLEPEYSSPTLCISPRSAGQEIEDGQAKTSVTKLSTVHSNFSNFTTDLLELFRLIPWNSGRAALRETLRAAIPKVTYFRVRVRMRGFGRERQSNFGSRGSTRNWVWSAAVPVLLLESSGCDLHDPNGLRAIASLADSDRSEDGSSALPRTAAGSNGLPPIDSDSRSVASSRPPRHSPGPERSHDVRNALEVARSRYTGKLVRRRGGRSLRSTTVRIPISFSCLSPMEFE
jgi:hypothetical protein